MCVVLLHIQCNSNNVITITHSSAACIFVPSNVQWALCVLAALFWQLLHVPVYLLTICDIYCVWIVNTHTIQFKSCIYHYAFVCGMCFCTVKHTVVTVFAALDYTFLYFPVTLSTLLNIHCVCLAATDTMQFQLCIFNGAFICGRCFCTVKHTVVTIFAALDYTLPWLPVMLWTRFNIPCVGNINSNTIQFKSRIYRYAFARGMHFCTVEPTVSTVRFGCTLLIITTCSRIFINKLRYILCLHCKYA